MKPLSMDIRRRAILLREQGLSAAEVAERLMISKRSAERCWKHWQEREEVPQPGRKGKRATRLKGAEEDLRQWVSQRPETTVDELVERLQSEHGISASRSTIWRALRSMGLRHKKNGVRRRAGPP